MWKSICKKIKIENQKHSIFQNILDILIIIFFL